jgi:excisionase family DNA binding protein
MKKGDVAKTPHFTQPSKLLTVREMSTYLRVHTRTIYRMLRHKQIPAFHVGNEWRFNLESIDQWCLQQEKTRP